MLFSHFQNQKNAVINACHEKILKNKKVECVLLTPEHWQNGEYKNILKNN